MYESVERMKVFASGYGVDLITVTAGNLGEHMLECIAGTRKRVPNIPMWVRGEDGREAPLSRNCTRDYKIVLIEREAARLAGRAPRQRLATGPRAVCLLGISYDERSRVKKARKEWITNSYPLVELMITRAGCEAYLASVGLEVPLKSACIFCPYHDDSYWLNLREHYPQQWQEAIEWDEKLRDMSSVGVREAAFLHRKLTPLAQVDLQPRKQQAERSMFDPHGFENECDGYCGV